MRWAGALVVSALALSACDAGPETSRPPEGDVRYVDVLDAVTPVAGRDYTRLAEVTGPDARGVFGVLPDGRLLVQREDWVVLDARTGRAASTGVDSTYAFPRDLVGDVVYFSGPRRAVIAYDVGSGRVRTYDPPEVGGVPVTFVGADPRGRGWWYDPRPSGQEQPTRYWSAPLDRPDRLRAHGSRIGTVVLDEGVAQLLRAGDGFVLEVRSAQVALPEDCVPRGSLLGEGSTVAIGMSCSGKALTFLVQDGVLTDAVDLGGDVEVQSVSDRYVAWFGYVYDLAAGRLLDVTEMRGEGETPPVAGPGSDDVVMAWPQGRPDDTLPRRVLVVQGRP